MIFYHGTDSSSFLNIMKEGLRPSFITQSLEQATYYAEVASEDNDSLPVILTIDIEPENFSLRADMPSIEEPIVQVYKKHDFYSEEEFHEALSDDNNKEFYWPNDHEWEYSLFLVESVFCESHLPATVIKTLDFSKS